MARLRFDNLDKWVCTNPNVFQYCRKMDETTWIFIRPKDDLLEQLKQRKDITPKELLKEINRQTDEAVGTTMMMKDWYMGTVDFDEYTLSEAMRYTEVYGDVNINDKERVAECIFESLMFN